MKAVVDNCKLLKSAVISETSEEKEEEKLRQARALVFVDIR